MTKCKGPHHDFDDFTTYDFTTFTTCDRSRNVSNTLYSLCLTGDFVTLSASSHFSSLSHSFVLVKYNSSIRWAD